MEAKEHYLGQLRELNGHGPSWLGPIRRAACDRFAQVGFPTTRDEEWKYTNVAPITSVMFQPAERQKGVNRDTAHAIDTLSLGTGVELVFVGGHLVSERMQAGVLPGGVRVMGLGAAFETEQELVESHLGRYANCETNAFTALNTAFLVDGAFVYLPKGVIVEQPIHLLFLGSPAGPSIASHPRNLVVAEEGSAAKIVETYVGSGRESYFTNAVTEVTVGPNASVVHYKVQREGEAAFHVGTVEAHQGRDSRFHSFSMSIGGALVRNDINAVLASPGGHCSFDGLYLGNDRQHVDHHTSIDHREPHCTSEQLYKGVLDGNSTAVFNGKVFVRPDAQKSDARQSNKNLLLSEGSTVNTKPQLEIFADDVKCSHGATIGRLEEEAMFYLRSRGIGEAAARSILIKGFANEVLDRIVVGPLSVQLEGVLRSRFRDPGDRERDE